MGVAKGHAQNRRQKVVSRGALCLCGGLYVRGGEAINLGGLGALFLGLSPPDVWGDKATGLLVGHGHHSSFSYFATSHFAKKIILRLSEHGDVIIKTKTVWLLSCHFSSFWNSVWLRNGMGR